MIQNALPAEKIVISINMRMENAVKKASKNLYYG